MDNMQVQGKPMAQEDQVEREEIEKAQEAGVIDFNKKEDPGKSLNYTHKFAKPTEIMGRKYESLTFYFEELTGDDVENVELELQQRNIVVLSAEVSSAFQSAIAAKAAHMASDEIRRLPLRDYMKIKNAARNFLVAVGY
ncbi:phage tail assembly protein [Acetatifactor aquisgranensis]|uniref:phage tail assembly protein n=1 Tax=Acetatifactor aquisgranensis TaxID=2941233 RepID=UPI00204000BF|nr:phage tail assembly protein [Acetatifactor aquisgranensis]